MKFTKKIALALGFYVTALIASNTLGVKLMPLPWGMHLSVAIFTFPFVFMMTDVIGELYGKKMAKMFVWSGFFSLLLFIVFTSLAVIMPASDDFQFVGSFSDVFGLSLRFTIASIVAFILGEYQDVISFFFFKKLTKPGKMFWLRSNLSNLWSQFVDTTVWTLIAFLGVIPLPAIVGIIIPWWLFKFIAGFLATPISYLGLKLLKPSAEDREEEN